jgi:hypothetical protein
VCKYALTHSLPDKMEAACPTRWKQPTRAPTNRETEEVGADMGKLLLFA